MHRQLRSKIFLYSRPIVFTIVVITSILFLQGGSCCSTQVAGGAILGKTPPSSLDRAWNLPSEIWACPGTEFQLCWHASSDVDQISVDNGVGDSTERTSCRTLKVGDKDTEYVIKGTGGDCDRSARVFVKVIKDGTKGLIDLPAVEQEKLTNYQTNLDPSFYDPNIVMTSIAITPDDIVSGFGWRLGKIDTNGSIASIAPIFGSPITPSGFPMQLAGQHKVTKTDGFGIPANSNPPAPMRITENLTLTCKAP